MGTVISSGTIYVNNGEHLDSPDILNSGIVYVNNGGSATKATIHDGGEEYVLADGFDGAAMVSSGGILHVNTGESYKPQVFNGGIISGIGATISSAVVNNGGTMALSGYVHQISGLVSRGNVVSTIINSDGVVTLQKYAACSNTTINGGKLLAYSGTEVYGVNMTDGYILIDSAYAFSVTMSGGSMMIRGENAQNPGVVESLNMRSSSGIVWVEEYGVISGGNVSHGVRVGNNGLVKDLTVQYDGGGYLEILNGGTQSRGVVYGSETIAAGGTAYDVTFHGAVDVWGNAINCNLAGGSADVSSGGFFSGTAIQASDSNRASFVISSGGSAVVTRASGTYIDAFLYGGVLDVNAGKIDWVYLKEGGTFNLGSGASIGISADVATGVMNVEGVLRDPRVSSGASVMISSGGIVTGRYDILNGAVVSAAEGATVDFDLTRTSAGAAAMLSSLSLIGGSPNYSLTVDGTQSVGSYKLAGGAAGFNKTLTVKDSAGTELGTIKVDGDAVGYNGKMYGLKLTDDTLSVLVVNGSSENVFMGTVTSGTKIISSGMSALGATVDVKGKLIIEDHGRASNTLVKDGGGMIVSSGADIRGVTVKQGGVVRVESDGVVENTVVDGGMLFIEEGWAFVYSKGNLVSSGTIVKNGGSLIISGGQVEGAIVSGGSASVLVTSSGTFMSATVADAALTAWNTANISAVKLLNGAVMFLDSGASAQAIHISKGGLLDVQNGGELNNIFVSSGGVLTGTLRGGRMINMRGGTLDLGLYYVAPKSLFIVDGDTDLDASQDFLCTLTVGDEQASGMYNLIENAYGFDKTITVVNTSGDELGTLAVGRTASINGKDYTLELHNDYNDYSLTLSISGGAPTPTMTAKSDIDGNGVSDVMFVWTGTVEQPGNYQHGYWMNGTSEWLSANSTHPAEWENLGCYDMTGDGKADSVLVGNVEVEGVKGAYIGYYADANDLPDGSTWVNIGYLNNADDIAWKNKVGRLTGKSANSIVWYAPELYALGAWTDGTETWVTLSSDFGGDAWTLVGCGDFDGDQKDSVLMSYNGGQMFYAVDLDGTAPQNLGSANWSGWDVRAIGDFAGDGKDDIILFHKDLGAMVMLADGNADNFASIGQLDASDWFVIGAGDYNADGKDDLLVRQYTTGMLGYYNSGDTTQWVELGRGVDMNWTVIA